MTPWSLDAHWLFCGSGEPLRYLAEMWGQGSPFSAAHGCYQEPGPGEVGQYTSGLLLILLLATGRVGT